MGKLEGKVAVVTGAASGIGHGIAAAFAREGADVAVVDQVGPEQAAGVLGEIGAAGRRGLFVRCDVSDEAAVRSMAGQVQAGLGPRGTLVVIGAAQSMQVSPLLLIAGMREIKGWYSGTAIDSQDTLAFSVLKGVRSMNEVYPLERVAEAYERMMSGKARFRVVLTMAG